MRPKGSKNLSAVEIKAALLANFGNAAQAAEALGCHRNTIMGRIARSKELRAAKEEALESALDLAENTLIKKIREGNLTATIFFLKCQGRHRGYIEQHRIESTNKMVHEDWIEAMEQDSERPQVVKGGVV